jgi:hypothetical protein
MIRIDLTHFVDELTIRRINGGRERLSHQSRPWSHDVDE